MTQLILTEEQASLLRQALEPLQLCDPQGNVLRTLEPAESQEVIAELKRRAASPGPRYSGDQVQARLLALESEWNRTGGFDKTYLLDFLGRLNQADPGHTRHQDRAS
ncbi:MAG TPA: hypothetical protein VGZ25_06500 [Gemmataceae bacterium]|jgi:uncharacterized protein YmfQ (DUF2313 family)|nr:hypothetical protein [Gemmataceae bacterium]